MSSKKLRVLLVDDNSEHLGLSSRSLPPEEFEVVAVASGKEAIRMLTRDRFDIVVVDSTLSDMTGLELLGKVREKGYRTPVALLSEQDDPELALKASKAGACDLIVKTYHYYANLRSRLLENVDTCSMQER